MDKRDREQPLSSVELLNRPIITTVRTSEQTVEYLVHPQRLGEVLYLLEEDLPKPQDIIPVTGLNREQFHAEDALKAFRKFAEYDDVWIWGFNETIILLDTVEARVDPNDGFPQQRVHGFVPAEKKRELEPGPYFIYNGGLHQAWRLFPDTLRAFNFGMIPRATQDPHSSAYDPVTVLSRDGLHKAIAVPSRLYYPNPTREKPLSGVRFVVDDLFSVEGVKTTFSHEAWMTMCRPCNSTSYLIKKLVEFGAVIVGKTKASQFGVLNTSWVDVSSPKNPRADGYQEALGSAPGAGSALAGYRWVDCVVAMDTLSGVMETAEWYGLFALRLSHHWPFCDGVNLACPLLSAATFMARSLERVRQATCAIVKNIASKDPGYSPPLSPNMVISFEDMFGDEVRSKQKRLAAGFTDLLQAKLPDGKVETDLSKRWEHRPPDGKPGETLEGFMNDCAFDSYCSDFDRKYNNFFEKCIEDYRKVDRRVSMVTPYQDEAVDFICDNARNISEEKYEENCAQMERFREWFDEQTSSLTSSPGRPIVMMPTTLGHQPRSRVHSPSQYAPTAQRMQNWDECLSSILQRPQLILPMARTYFISPITDAREALPLCASIMGGTNCDLELTDLAMEVMKENELDTRVEVGRMAHWRNLENWQNFVSEGILKADAAPKKMEEEEFAKTIARSLEEK